MCDVSLNAAPVTPDIPLIQQNTKNNKNTCYSTHYSRSTDVQFVNS